MANTRTVANNLDAFYKVTKIVGVIIGVLALAITGIAGIAVGHWRIDAVQQLQLEAKTDRQELRQKSNEHDVYLSEIRTDVKWMRQSMERNK